MVKTKTFGDDETDQLIFVGMFRKIRSQSAGDSHGDTPRRKRYNKEPEHHPFEKEKDLLKLHVLGSMLNSQGCI